MAQRYRLTAKPGIVRAGRFVNTRTKPIIVLNKPNTSRATQPSTLRLQQPQKVMIQRPPNIKAPRNNVVKPRVVVNKSKVSRLRSQKELHQTQYNAAIERLRDCGKGRILIMVACGPSILETDIVKLKGHPLIDIMSINKPDPRVHPTKYWVFCDNSQYLRNREVFDAFPNTLINAWSVRARHKNQIMVRNRSGKGFSKNLLTGYYIGRSTTFANMQTALWMNYDKIFIFGCDMSAGKDGKVHFYGRNPDVEPGIRVKRFEKEAEYYMAGAKQLTPQERQKFVFCSSYNKWPFIEYFSKLDHIEAPDKILEIANNKTN